MADEALFLLLHNEMVSGVYKSAEQGEVENGRCITKLENMGFRVGQGLIERASMYFRTTNFACLLRCLQENSI